MRIAMSGLVCLVVLGGHVSVAHTQNFLFKFPRTGGFKFKQNDRFDFSNTQHFAASGVLAVGFYDVLRNAKVGHPRAWAVAITTVVGLLKELEDGYREGWGMKDVMFNELGIATFLLLQGSTRYTLTLKDFVRGPNDYGLGIRFFRSADFTPLKASLGLYLMRDNRNRSWFGVDSHFVLHKRAEVHIGSSMVNLADPNRFNFRLNVGIGLRLF